jgi:hypothetical protein
MRYLRKYESNNEIITTCKKYAIYDYTINDDGSIDVNRSVNLSRRGLTKLPLKFRKINSCFYSDFNGLKSLEGSPIYVNGIFSCDDNLLTSLVYCPKHISVNFHCHHNEIETFEGLDFVHIGGDFYCYGNPIWWIWILFRDHTKFEFFNGCDPIRENRVIILDRLNFFLDYIGKETVTDVNGYKCI